jgi:hypothetical protein
MNFSRYFVTIVNRGVLRQHSSLNFGGLRLRLSFGWSWTMWLELFHFYTCFCLVFPLPLAFLVGRHPVSTCFLFRLASCCDLLWLDLSTSLRALAVNSLGGLITFRLLGAYVDSSGTLISARWVHSSLRDFSVVKSTLVRHSGASGRVIVYEDFGYCGVIHLFKHRCSTDDVFPLIGVVAS